MPGDIDLIIACTVTPDSFTPSLSCRLQAALGADNAFAFDLTAACSGFVYASDVADSFLKSGKAKAVLVVCAEVLSQIMDYTDRTVCCLFGDGAGAAVYEWSDTQQGVRASFMRAEGDKGDALLAQAFTPCDTLHKQGRQQMDFLKMDGRAVFRFTAKAVPSAIDGVLKKADIDMRQVDWVVPHQANLRILDVIARRYHLPKEKVYVNMDRFGNTSSASVPICLNEMRRNGLLREGQTIVCTGFGGGLTYGAFVLKL